jgi:hypothetical protein
VSLAHVAGIEDASDSREVLEERAVLGRADSLHLEQGLALIEEGPRVPEAVRQVEYGSALAVGQAFAKADEHLVGGLGPGGREGR